MHAAHAQQRSCLIHAVFLDLSKRIKKKGRAILSLLRDAKAVLAMLCLCSRCMDTVNNVIFFFFFFLFFLVQHILDLNSLQDVVILYTRKQTISLWKRSNECSITSAHRTVCCTTNDQVYSGSCPFLFM